jgi:hypothetical protein
MSILRFVPARHKRWKQSDTGLGVDFPLQAEGSFSMNSLYWQRTHLPVLRGYRAVATTILAPPYTRNGGQDRHPQKLRQARQEYQSIDTSAIHRQNLFFILDAGLIHRNVQLTTEVCIDHVSMQGFHAAVQVCTDFTCCNEALHMERKHAVALTGKSCETLTGTMRSPGLTLCLHG